VGFACTISTSTMSPHRFLGDCGQTIRSNSSVKKQSMAGECLLGKRNKESSRKLMVQGFGHDACRYRKSSSTAKPILSANIT
jgi:hypothetical protein